MRVGLRHVLRFSEKRLFKSLKARSFLNGFHQWPKVHELPSPELPVFRLHRNWSCDYTGTPAHTADVGGQADWRRGLGRSISCRWGLDDQPGDCPWTASRPAFSPHSGRCRTQPHLPLAALASATHRVRPPSVRVHYRFIFHLKWKTPQKWRFRTAVHVIRLSSFLGEHCCYSGFGGLAQLFFANFHRDNALDDLLSMWLCRMNEPIWADLHLHLLTRSFHVGERQYPIFLVRPPELLCWVLLYNSENEQK